MDFSIIANAPEILSWRSGEIGKMLPHALQRKNVKTFCVGNPGLSINVSALSCSCLQSGMVVPFLWSDYGY